MSLGMQQYVMAQLAIKKGAVCGTSPPGHHIFKRVSSIFIFKRNFTEQEADMLGMHNRRVNVMVNSLCYKGCSLLVLELASSLSTDQQHSAAATRSPALK